MEEEENVRVLAILNIKKMKGLLGKLESLIRFCETNYEMLSSENKQFLSGKADVLFEEINSAWIQVKESEGLFNGEEND